MLSTSRRANARRGLRRCAVVSAASVVAALIPALAVSKADAAPLPTVVTAGDEVWHVTGARPQAAHDGNARQVHPSSYRAYALDGDALAASLAGAPAAGSAAAEAGRGVSVRIPAPNGRLVEFDVVGSDVLAPELAAAHPELKAYVGTAVGYADSISIQVTPTGTHVSVRGAHPAWFVDPAYQNDDSLYLSYYGRSLPQREQPLVEPELDEQTRGAIRQGAQSIGEGPGNAVKHRLYRLALLTDPSYAEFVAPGLNDGAHDAESNSAVLAAKMVLVSRVNDVYGDDLGITLQLIAQSDLLNLNTDAKANQPGGPCGPVRCYETTGGSTQPILAGGCTSPLLTRTRLVIGQLVGAANFDIGHIGLGLNGGGVASLGVVGGNSKAQGCTGIPFPTGDFYAIDYVAHEMGHQFAGNHTFNGTQLNCSGGNRNAGTSVEPGSGSSVMAYAGICQQDNLQPHTDPYFSQRTQTEIGSYVNATLANVNEVDASAFTGFDAADSYTLSFGPVTTAPITRDGSYSAATVKLAIETAFALAGTPGVVATVAGYLGGTFGDTGIQVTLGGTLAGTDVANMVVNPTGFTAQTNDIAKGGPPTNGGFSVDTTANHNPDVTAPAGTTIPMRTPFTLTGSATDADGDPLLYLWEQNDRGSFVGTGLVDNNKVNGPLFRVFGKYADVSLAESLTYYSPDENLATADPSRTFPDLDQILADNTNAETGTCPAAPPPPASGGATNVPVPVIDCYSEFLPTASYLGDLIAGNSEPSLDFRLTARDDKGPSGGTDFADTKVTIDKTAGPFQVTSQATPASYDAGSSQTITWDVNNTDKPTLAPDVRITFSSDGGQTFDTVLAASTPNDGSAQVTMPLVDTTTGRIKIEAVGNYFFDVNDGPVTVTRHFTVVDAIPDVVNAQYSDQVPVSFTAYSDFGEVTAFEDAGAQLPDGLDLIRSPIDPGARPSSATFTVMGAITVAPGDYPVSIDVSDGTHHQTVAFTLHVLPEQATPIQVGETTFEAPHGGNDVLSIPLIVNVGQQVDGTLGDLSHATVTIRDTIAHEVLCADVPLTIHGYGECTYSADLPLGSGRIYNLQLDVGGGWFTGSGSGSLSVTIDDTSPDTTIGAGPPEGSLLLAGATTLGFASNEPGSTFSCTLDGAVQQCLPPLLLLSGLGARTHVVTVTATDQAGNVDPTPAVRRFTVPMDDAALASTKGTWTRTGSGNAFLGTVSSSRKKGSTLSTTVSGATSLALVASTGKKGGTVKVFLDGELLRTISLKGGAAERVVIPVATFATGRSGTVTIVNTTKRAQHRKKQRSVVIDGLGVTTTP